MPAWWQGKPDRPQQTPTQFPRSLDTEKERRIVFERLAHEHARALYGAAFRMSRHPDAAQDLAQETLVRAYVAFDTFVPGSDFRAWLLRLLTTSITHDRRRQKITIPEEIEAVREDGAELPTDFWHRLASQLDRQEAIRRQRIPRLRFRRAALAVAVLALLCLAVFALLRK